MIPDGSQETKQAIAEKVHEAARALSTAVNEAVHYHGLKVEVSVHCVPRLGGPNSQRILAEVTQRL